MNSLRTYIDILAEADAPAGSFDSFGNPVPQGSPQATQADAPPATAAPVQVKAAGWTPTPEQAKWLGGADQQDPYILNRMPGAKPPVTHFTDPKDQASAKQMGFPATAPVEAPAPAPAEATPVAQGEVEATPLPPAGQGATPANRDSMPFSSAFADARKKGEPKFTWKGKEYTTQVAPAQTQKVMPQLPKADQAQNTFAQSVANSSVAPGYGQKGPTVAAAQGKDASNPLNQTAPSPAPQQQGATPSVAPIAARPTWSPMQGNVWDSKYGKTHNPDGTPKAVKESAYDEVERLVSLIHYR